MYLFNLNFNFIILFTIFLFSVTGFPPKFKKISELLEKNPLTNNQITDLNEEMIDEEEENNDEELVKLCQLSDVPSLQHLFNGQKMEQTFTNIRESNAVPQIENEIMNENEEFADHFFADNNCASDFFENLTKKEIPMKNKLKNSKNEIIKSDEISLEMPHIHALSQSKSGTGSEQLTLNDLKKKYNIKNEQQKEFKLKKIKQKSEIVENEQPIDDISFLRNTRKMLAHFKIRHEQRWKIIRKFLLRKNGPNLAKVPKNLGENSKAQRVEENRNKTFLTNLGNSAKNPQNSVKNQQTMPEYDAEFEEFDQKYQSDDEFEDVDQTDQFATDNLISAWHFIETAILGVEISLLPFASNISGGNRYLFQMVDMDKALCALISSDQVINNLRTYIIWTRQRVVEDKMFDQATSVSLMQNMKENIKRVYTTRKACYKEQNKIFLNLRVYSHLYATIERQLSSRTIEDTVEGIGDTTVGLDFVNLCMFAREFLGSLNELMEMVAEIGIEQARQRQCKNL